jgi:hypothetical protein
MQMIDIQEKKLGWDHSDTLESMSQLASTYRSQGRWDAAEELGGTSSGNEEEGAGYGSS